MEEKESLKVGEFLQEFYAVTGSRSVYRISVERDKDNCPIVEKVALNGKSRVKVGQCLRRATLSASLRPASCFIARIFRLSRAILGFSVLKRSIRVFVAVIQAR